jgi:hypothetical protein
MTPKRHNPTGTRRSPFGRMRRGGVTAGLVITLSLLSALVVTAVVVKPQYLLASGGGGSPELIRAADPAHQEVIELLGSLISRSKEVLAIHQRGEGPYLELVLWLEDGENAGQIDPAEIGVISHSELLQTVSLYGLAEGVDEEEEAAPDGVHASMSDIRAAAFCTAWRGRPDVARRLLARRVAAMEAEAARRSQNSSTLLRISLTWAAEWADSPDEASVLLDVAMRQVNDA